MIEKLNSPKISIITPVYNVERWLERCIDSVLAQSYQDFELLLVDDGSTDRSSEICDRYAENDTRIRVFHKENGGVSSARNVGLDEAKGEWIVFVDSDDWVRKDYLSVMMDWASAPEDFVMQNIHTPRYDYPYPNKVFSGEQLGKVLVGIRGPLSFTAPYCKLFSSNIIKKNEIRFPLGINNGEDGIFYTRYLSYVYSVAMIEADEYNYNRMEGGLSSKYRSFDEEWRTYSEWREAMISLFGNYPNSITNPIAAIWKNRIGQHFVRCLQCGSRMKPVPSLSEQVRILRRIPRDDFEEYKKYFYPDRLRRKLLKFLLCKQWYVLYVILGNIEQKVTKQY